MRMETFLWLPDLEACVLPRSARTWKDLPGRCGYQRAGECEADSYRRGCAAEDWKAVDVIAPVDTPVNPDMPTPEQKAIGTRRLNEANQLRREKKENWVNPELTAFLAGEDERASPGNGRCFV